MVNTVEGKTVIITGASMGIGKATALEFAKHGAKVVLAARKVDLLNQVKDTIEAHGGEVLVTQVDVCKLADIQKMVEATIQRFGRIDILVNNAGFGLYAPVTLLPEEKLQDVFDVNVYGCLRCIQTVYPQMKKQGGGQIINISSIVGLRSIPTNVGYCMSKFALNGLSEGLRTEAALDNISVLSIYPGYTHSEFQKNSPVVGKAPKHPALFAKTSEDVARAIVKAAKKNKRDTILTMSAWFMHKANTLIPGILDKVILSGYKKLLRKQSS